MVSFSDSRCLYPCNGTPSHENITTLFAFFVKRLSCLTHLLEVLKTRTPVMDEGIYVIHLDYCKAFDSVPRIIMKFSCSFVIEKHSIASVASLLSDRETRVTAKQQESAWVSVGYSAGFHRALRWHHYCFLVNRVAYSMELTFRPGSRAT